MRSWRVFRYSDIICFIVVLLICFLLYRSDAVPISIDVVWDFILKCLNGSKLLTVGLMPVYVALMIFGAAALGIFLVTIVKRLFFSIKSR
ncbi:MAG: hypothetical protein SFW66_00530 [Gammaproteobacteria bacterium]|nr:hypothetical protein [Gammaproteobacteria bacterium]